MKKFAIVAVLVFAFAITLNVAFADKPNNGCRDCGQQQTCPCPSIDITNTNNGVKVINEVDAKSITGLNEANGWFSKGFIKTGTAVSKSSADSTVGYNLTNIASPVTIKTSINNSNNSAFVKNEISSKAISGLNEGKMIIAGKAISKSSALSVVGYNITVIGAPMPSSN